MAGEIQGIRHGGDFAGWQRLFAIDIPIFSAPLSVRIVRMVAEGSTVVETLPVEPTSVDGFAKPADGANEGGKLPRETRTWERC